VASDGGASPRGSASIPPPATGDGLAILVNANAKRGGRRIAAQLGRALPGARVRLTRTIDEIESWLKSIAASPPRCLLAAGGDGTAIALVNALRRALPEGAPFPMIGLLPLGTGNAWAHSTGAKKLGTAVRLLASRSALPTRRYGLVDCEGTLCSFAGCGWDAQVLNDYKEQLRASKGPARHISKSVYGYLTAMLVRTAPKALMYGRPHLLIENLGDEVYTMTPDRRVVPVPGVKRGSILYEGLASVTGAATCPEFGYGFRAYPHAERLFGTINVRVYDRNTVGAIGDIPLLWRGTHPLRGMHDWFATAVRMTFSRPVPLEIGGDAVGERRTVEYRVHERSIEMLDWRAMA